MATGAFGILALIVILVEVGATVPGLGMLSTVGSFVTPVAGPLLLLTALPALVLGVSRSRPPRRSTATVATAAIGGVAVLSSAAVLALFTSAVTAAGGSINLWTALTPTSVTAAHADAHEVYTTSDGQALSAVVYQPPGLKKTRPTLIYIHGGGWNSGSNDAARTDYHAYANHGWLVVSVNYRLATTTDHTWDQAPADVACALSWTVMNASRLGADPTRLVLAGDSAGGNLAINLAYSAALGTARPSCRGPVPVPLAVIASYPAVDPTDVYSNNFRLGPLSIRDAVDDYVGGSPQQFPSRFAAISSATYESRLAPATFIIEPEHDTIVPPAGVYAFAREADAVTNNVTLAKVPFANHTFDFYAAGTIGDQARLTITQSYLDHLVPRQ